MHHSLSTHLLKDTSVASKFWHSSIKLTETPVYRFLCGLKFSHPLSKYQGTRALDCAVRACLLLYEATTLPSKTAAPRCTPHPPPATARPAARRARGHSVSTALPISSILTGVRWHLTVVLICFSLTTRDVGAPSHMLIRHLFTFLGKASVQSSAHFVIGLFSSFWILRILCIFWVPVLYHTRALQIQVTPEQV